MPFADERASVLNLHDHNMQLEPIDGTTQLVADAGGWPYPTLR